MSWILRKAHFLAEEEFVLEYFTDFFNNVQGYWGHKFDKENNPLPLSQNKVYVLKSPFHKDFL